MHANAILLRTKSIYEVFIQTSFKSSPLLRFYSLCFFSMCPHVNKSNVCGDVLKYSCTLRTTDMSWHIALRHPSQIKWQMLFFASWIFLGQVDFKTFPFAQPCFLQWCDSPAYLFAFSFDPLWNLKAQQLKGCLLFSPPNFKQGWCVIACDKERVVVDVSLSFLTDTQPSALFSFDVYPAHPLCLLHIIPYMCRWEGWSPYIH